MEIRANTNKLDYFIEICKKNNLKITPQRMAIFLNLENNKTHPSTDSIFKVVKKQFPAISYDTVNRTLLTFSDIGLIDIVENHGTVRRFDSDVKSHHHFHCSSCNTIFDLYWNDFDRLPIPEEIKNKYSIQSKRVVLKGLCDNCKTYKNKTTINQGGEEL
jgi:Fur family transcriptional regulator, peroxide stress response regulator